MVTKTPGTEQDWELASGLPNDMDGWIKGASFGSGREEYQEAIRKSGGGAGSPQVMLTLPLFNAEGEPIGQQAYSVGSGWIASEDGSEISHPVRANIVRTSMYGRLIKRVKDELGVEVQKYGTPFRASTWDGLGFHWLLEPHPTVSGDEREGLMPTEYLGDTLPFEEGGARAASSAIPPEVDAKLAGLVKGRTVVEFQRQAVRLPEVAELSDEAMAYLMDRGPDGYWAKHV